MAYTSFSPASSTNLTIVYGIPYQGGARWRYVSGDAQATVAASSYISDAAKYGMQVGDIVEQFNSSGFSSGLPAICEYVVTAVRGSSTSSPSADLSAGKIATS